MLAPPPATQAPISYTLFDVGSARVFRAECRRRSPRLRLVAGRDWSQAPRLHEKGVLRMLRAAAAGRGGGDAGAASWWYWAQSEEAFRAQASHLLRHFVHPLVAGGRPFCLGFPFPATVLAPAPLTLAERGRLDLEDIGLLLGEEAVAAAMVRQDAVSAAVHDGLDPSQLAAARHCAGAARVLAPAGSGKTKTLVARVVELVGRGVNPGEILLLAFNTKAAEQLEERLAARAIPCTRRIEPGSPPRAVHCATFNAFGARYQREVMRRRVEVDADGADRRPLMRQAMDEAGCGLDVLKPVRGADPVGGLLAALPRVRAGLEAPEAVWLHVLSRGDPAVVTLPFAPIHERYTRLQELAGRQSFDDQIYFAVVDLLASPHRRRLLQRRYRYLLVDEFQDLNAAQLALVDVLSRPQRNLFVVGDDDQLIYGWRYADPDAILGFHNRVPPPPHSATYALGTNYRCSKAVVAAGARLVEHNQRREAKVMAPRAGAQEGAVVFRAAPSWAERGATMCEFLRGERARLGCTWRDLAVLSRYRSQQFAVALALDAGGIPRAPSLGVRLLTLPAARLLRACLALLLTPELLDAQATHRLALDLAPHLRSDGAPARKLRVAPSPPDGDTESGRPMNPHAPDPELILQRRVTSLRARLGFSPAEHPLSSSPPPAFGAAANSAPAATASPTGAPAAEPSPPAALSAAAVVAAVLDGFGLAEAWQRGPSEPVRGGPSPGAASAASAASESPAAAAAHGDAGPPFRLFDALGLLAAAHPEPAAFLAAWDRLAAEEGQAHASPPPDTPADQVALATIHAAKGREYASVVIPDYDCNVTCWSAEEIEEERRVLYVGITRACDSLLLTIDSSRPYVHPFLRELVPPPEPDEAARLAALLAHEPDAAAAPSARRRLADLRTLFPDVCPPSDAAAAPAE